MLYTVECFSWVSMSKIIVVFTTKVNLTRGSVLWYKYYILIVVRHLWFYLWILLLKAVVFCKLNCRVVCCKLNCRVVCCKLNCRVVCCQGHLYKSVTFDQLHVDDILYGWLVKCICLSKFQIDLFDNILKAKPYRWCNVCSPWVR